MSSRQQVMNRIVLALVGVALTVSASIASADEERHAGTSVQLWSVKDQVSEDIRGTLEDLADMGLDGIELAGNLGEFTGEPEAFKAYLNSLGLEISGAHVGVDQFNDANFADTIELYRTLGVNRLIVPMDARAWDPERIDDLIADLNRIAEQLKPYDMKTGYHNHHREFDSYKDTTFWDYLADNTADDVLLQLDVGWTYFAGKDPAEVIERYRSRIETVHFKAQMTRYADIRDQAQAAAGADNPFGEFGVIFQHNQKSADSSDTHQPLIGQDSLDWQAIIEALEGEGVPVWYVVEQEIYPNDMPPMKAVEISMDGLQDELNNN